jgi:hypothetical protein
MEVNDRPDLTRLPWKPFSSVSLLRLWVSLLKSSQLFPLFLWHALAHAFCTKILGLESVIDGGFRSQWPKTELRVLLRYPFSSRKMRSSQNQMQIQVEHEERSTRVLNFFMGIYDLKGLIGGFNLKLGFCIWRPQHLWARDSQLNFFSVVACNSEKSSHSIQSSVLWANIGTLCGNILHFAIPRGWNRYFKCDLLSASWSTLVFSSNLRAHGHAISSVPVGPDWLCGDISEG